MNSSPVLRSIFVFALLLAGSVFFAGGAAGCTAAYKQPAAFFSAGDGPVLYGLSREAAAGRLALSGAASLSYVFEPPLEVPPGFSLEAGYRLTFPGGDAPAVGWNLAASHRPVLEISPASPGAAAWELPLDAGFLGLTGYVAAFRYAVPVGGVPIKELKVSFAARDGSGEKAGNPGSGGPVLELYSLGLVPRWFGYALEEGVLAATPFVFVMPGAPNSPVIDPPAAFRPPLPAALSLKGVSGETRINAGETRFVFTPGPASSSISLPSVLLGRDPYPAAASAGSGGLPGTAFTVESVAALLPSALKDPIPLDPGVIPVYPRDAWREGRYEVFRWPAFPRILIFDTADYRVQERLFKRLAFFVEKRDFRGRLAGDRELEGLHGWNAHDYRAEDLARFFEAARQEDFPLLDEERELLAVLLHNGIVVRSSSGELRAGAGAVLSISRESPEYLRRRFLVHEGFHGVFFMDEDFREFSRLRWEGLDADAKRVFRSYLDFQRYDLADPYLVVNEFMAYCLQQPVSLAGPYFGGNLPRQLHASSWRHSVLPPSEESPGGERSWPSLARAFVREAEAFSAYASRRWGFAAGRISSVTAESPAGP
ncbi:MAG: hypothetical protein LBH57_04585 [Treponema sp.]|jgi:hypothetical protein|nr:hypothetical protein [Treponema sp.]